MKIVENNYINGMFVKARGATKQTIINPTNEEILCEILLGNKADINSAVKSAKEAFITFKHFTLEQKCEILQNIHEELLKAEDELNELAILEFGSNIATTKRRTKAAIDSFLAVAKELKKYKFKIKNDKYSFILKEPVGIIGAIIPWNACYAHLSSNIAPSIAANCCLVIKPSELNALESEAYMKCLHKAGIPKGVVNIVNGNGKIAGEALVKHKDINAISFIGSSTTGRRIFKNASSTIKRLVLELGGKSPAILLKSSNFSKDIPEILISTFSNNGQACHAGTRLLVPKNRLEEVENLLIKEISSLNVGDPKEAKTQIGPMINKAQYERVQNYINDGIKEGAKVLIGGTQKPDGIKKGYFVKPTIFTNVKNSMKIAQEEIFGPVLCVITYEDNKDAIKIANETIFGLSAYIFGDEKEAFEMSKEIISGRVLINAATSCAKNSPFGGMKQSGLNRMGGKYSIDNFLEYKSILF